MLSIFISWIIDSCKSTTTTITTLVLLYNLFFHFIFLWQRSSLFNEKIFLLLFYTSHVEDSECKTEQKRFGHWLSNACREETVLCQYTSFRDAHKDTMILPNGTYPLQWPRLLSHRINTLACLRPPMSLTGSRGHSLAPRIISIHNSTSQEGVVLFFSWQQLSGMDMRRKIMNVSSAKWTAQVASSFSLLSWCFFSPEVRKRLDIIKPCNMCPFCPLPRKAIKRCLSNLFYLEMNLFFTTFAMRDPITA